MIGGPNQSHKVNFKELPAEGKISNKNFRSPVVNLFSENFLKNFRHRLPKEPNFLSLDPSRLSFSPARRLGRVEGELVSRLRQYFFRTFLKKFRRISGERTEHLASFALLLSTFSESHRAKGRGTCNTAFFVQAFFKESPHPNRY